LIAGALRCAQNRMTLLPARGSVRLASVIPVPKNQANVRRRRAAVYRAGGSIGAAVDEVAAVRKAVLSPLLVPIDLSEIEFT